MQAAKRRWAGQVSPPGRNRTLVGSHQLKAHQRKVNEKLEEAGAGQLESALESGFVDVEPLFNEDHMELEDVLDGFLAKLGEVLREGRAFPLFDDKTGDLVAARIAEGLLNPTDESVRRAKEIGGGARFMSYLPAFPHASIAAVLDIRDHLRSPLTRFRGAMARLAKRGL